MDTRPSRPILAVIGTRNVDFDVERRVVGDVEIVSGPGRNSEEVLEVGQGADVILAGASPRFDSATLERLDCRAIVRLGVGVDSVDLDAASRLGMWVAYVPDYGTEAVALHTVALVLSAMRRIPMADRQLRRGSWGFGEFRPLHLPSSLTLGLVGYGRIGRRVGELLAGFGFATILVTDPQMPPGTAAAPPVEFVDFDRVLAEADVVSLHAPPSSGQALIGGVELARMKPGAVLVNTARGALIDNAALVEALKDGTPGVAALDVYHPEPPEVSLFAAVADSVILTPHMAWYTEETELELRLQGAAEAKRIIDGQSPLHAVVTPEGKERP